MQQEPPRTEIAPSSPVSRGMARSGIASYASWRRSLNEVLSQVLDDAPGPPDLAFLFIAREYADASSEIVAAARDGLQAGTLVGCFGSGCIGGGRELERTPGLSILAMWLPATTVTAVHIDQGSLQALQRDEQPRLSTRPIDAWIVLTEPYRLDVSELLALLSRQSASAPVIGGMASNLDRSHRAELFIDDHIYQDGAIAVGFTGGIEMVPLVSQACEPIGEPWTVTSVDRTAVITISGRPAIDVMIETVAALPADDQRRAKRHLLVGFAANEYKDEFHRGDFLIRGVLGVDHARAAIVVGDRPRVGQTIQFQMRDPLTADIDLHQHLLEAKAQLAGRRPFAAFMASCCGRGSGLFNRPDHDAGALQSAFGPLAVGGFSSLGEIGTTDGHLDLHTYTASIGLFLDRQ